MVSIPPTSGRLVRTCCLIAMLQTGSWAAGQPANSGRIEGQVVLETSGAPLHNINVLIVELGSVAETGTDGGFHFDAVPAGQYDLLAFSGSLSSETRLVEVRPGETVQVRLALRIAPIKQEITVTASGSQETAFEAVQSVSTLDSFDLSKKAAVSVGEILDGELGVAKRSFGPGSSRPVVRGFDGDRVLVMQDGVRIGSLGSQSGDHGEPIDASNLERLEVLKGPATLLYGSNAIGGVVNAVTGHREEHQQAHDGLRGQFSSVAGSNNTHLGGSVRAEYGVGPWLVWAGGGGQRTGDYSSPLGPVENSGSRIRNTSGGAGWYGERPFFTVDYAYNDGRYGIPFAQLFAELEEEELLGIDIDFRRHNVRLRGGWRNLPGRWLESVSLSASYADWRHQELELLEGGELEVGTVFENREWVWRAALEQKKVGVLSGTVGVSGFARDYDVAGEEALSPPVDQTNFAFFALEQLDFERVRLQAGGRLEHNGYRPQGASPLPDRGFTGASAGLGARIDLWKRGALVANFTSSFRAPALEELYNFGPHVGNLAFEIGNSELRRERSKGLDLSLRHHGERLHASANFFWYGIRDFVFLGPTGEVEEGLVEARYLQEDARFLGGEFRLDIGLHRLLWLRLGLDTVDAQLTAAGQSLPRIPPTRAHVGLDLRSGGFSVTPEVVMADHRQDIFPTETPTAGYTAVNLDASYTLPRQHFVHQFSLRAFNLGDRVYRNHLSFIKDLAPEIGRGVSVSYIVKFF